MKKVLVLLLSVIFICSFLVGCEYLPPEVSGIFDSIGGIFKEHEHEFVLVKEKEATCNFDGVLYYECSCGEKKQEPGDPTLEHNYEVAYSNPATCSSDGTVRYKCSMCGMSKTETLPATGEHVYDETIEPSRIIKCSNSPCASVKIREYDGKYREEIAYVFSDEDMAKFNAIYAELEAIISAADAYDPALHAYSEDGELYEMYLLMEEKYEELYDVLEYVVGQYQIAQIEYHCDMENETAQNNFEHIGEVRVDLVAQFYTFSEPIYDSMYREFYYYGMTEQEILAFIFESNAVANEEYKALVDRNNEIEIEFNKITDPGTSMMVLDLYAEFIDNNKKIAELMQYENYLEYAYESMYDRDYSYQDVQIIADYVKEYISPVYIATYEKWNKITSAGNLTQGDIDQYYNQVMNSFFETYESNKLLNDYIDLLAFTSNSDKQMSFSDELNSLITDGNLFRGEYTGAYVTYLYGVNTPVAYFGPGYDHPFTVVHEFGHYMNEKYTNNEFSQSYDLLEMHSQGNEILYLAFLSEKMGKTSFNLVETYQMLVMLDTVVTALCVDTFEQAVYLDYYDGAYAAEIMADNTITKDEYDLLFNSIIEDFGATGYVMDTYWRHVTTLSPCYYVSYSVSALSVLQLYPKAHDDFDAAIDSYLKLFTYIDTFETEDDYMDTDDVLEYADLYSFTEEELYQSIYEYFTP